MTWLYAITLWIFSYFQHLTVPFISARELNSEDPKRIGLNHLDGGYVGYNLASEVREYRRRDEKVEQLRQQIPDTPEDREIVQAIRLAEADPSPVPKDLSGTVDKLKKPCKSPLPPLSLHGQGWVITDATGEQHTGRRRIGLTTHEQEAGRL
ncbi:hypothetical protein FF100_13425 [Methylobacterium terricola]|uniref:Uncharacterized protein n=1 Tax=Methylobacterium terricola TaxID=2583531 RepID=A0A5C4LIE1_9HYPH|nr:hypothetical protein [Methylobacterium terricola]TNC12674.1 hypothetical protein FF100_13425 [Methylobacterium terricola]